MFGAFLVFTTIIVGEALTDTRQWSSLAGRKEIPLDMDKLRNAAADPYEDPFAHTKELMMALQQGSRSFKVTASAADQATPEMTFDDIVALKDYNITTDYRLHPDADYHSLDNAHTLNVVTEVADHHLIHCGTSGTLIKTGDFIVGTADAAWRHRKFSVKTMHQKGLVYIRRAVAQDPVEDHGLQHKDSSPIVCVKTSTLEIHPFELFESFHVETVAHIPYIYKPLDREDKEVNPKASKGAKTTARAFKKKHAAAQPAGVATQALPVDPPAQTCSAIEETYFADYDEVYFSGFNSGSNDDFSFILGATVGCVSANKKFPCCSAFDFNYDHSTGEAEEILDLSAQGITGLYCSDCYVYTGVYIMVVLDYFPGGISWTCPFNCPMYMAMEVKLSGELGFNVEGYMLDPAFSGSYTKTLLSPTPNSLFYLPLGNGLSVSTYFGGLQAVLSGSGSATGAALFGVGASANAYLGVGYHDTKNEGVGWSLPAGVSYSVIPPYAYYDDFALNQINVDVELVATQIFEVAYSYALSAEFSVDLTGSANYAYSFASAKTPTMTIAVSSAKNSTSPSAAVVSKSSNGAAVGVPHLALSPGDSVTLSVKYENFNPGERTELFVSVHRDDDISELGVSILQVPFMVNGAGHGSFEVEWEVPWDSKFIGAHKVNGGPSPSRFSVHASNQMSVRFYAEQAIQITADPHVHGMILLPGPEDTIVVNTTYSVVWRSNGLTTFKRTVAGKSGMGHIEPTAFVNIELRFEDLDANGETALAGYVRLNAAPEPNDRSAPVVIPSSVLGGVTPDCTRRFFLVVASANNSNLMGWSRGYLNVVPALTPDAVSETSRRLMAYTGGLHKADGQFRRSPGSRKSMQTVRALPHATPAPLGSCSDSGTVTYTSFVEGSFNSFTVVSTFEFEIEDASASFELLTSQKCVSTPAAVGTEDGPPAVPSSVLSSAGVAGISVVSTLIAVVVIAVLYLRYFAACRGSGSTAKPDASTGNTAGEAVPEVEIDTMSANPLAIAATEV